MKGYTLKILSYLLAQHMIVLIQLLIHLIVILSLMPRIKWDSRLTHGKLLDYPLGDDESYWNLDKIKSTKRFKKKKSEIKPGNQYAVLCTKPECRSKLGFDDRILYNQWVTKHHNLHHKIKDGNNKLKPDPNKEWMIVSWLEIETERNVFSGERVSDEYVAEYRLVNIDNPYVQIPPIVHIPSLVYICLYFYIFLNQMNNEMLI